MVHTFTRVRNIVTIHVVTTKMRIQKETI